MNYTTLARFMTNEPNTAAFSFGNRHFHAISNDTGLFFQDDFKLSRNLVINLGLRWEYQSVYKERDDILVAPDGIEGAIAIPQRFRPPDEAYQPDYNNFSPRVGFAWSMDSGGKNVLRGGFGMYYSPFALIDLLYMAQVVGPFNDLPFSMSFDQAEVIRLGLKYPASNAKSSRRSRERTSPRDIGSSPTICGTHTISSGRWTTSGSSQGALRCRWAT